MLKENIVSLKYLQKSAADAQLAVHHVFFNGDCAVAFMPGDTGDYRIALMLFGQLMHNHRTECIRLVGIADVDGNTALRHGEYRVLVQHRGPHIGELAQLFIGNIADHAGFRNDSGIGDHKAGNIRPVFI